MNEEEIKAEMWERFMEEMKFVMERGDEPIRPLNFLGSVEKHRVKFMQIDIGDLVK